MICHVDQLLNSLAYSALLVLVVTGLAIIFGMRGVLNFAHGALYMVGAYLGYSIGSHFGFWIALIAVPLIMGLVGIVIEMGMLRPLKKLSPTYIALVTFGIAMVVEQIILMIYGGGSYTTKLPELLTGTISVFGIIYPIYRLFVIGVGIVFALSLVLWLRFSRWGVFVRAVSQDAETSEIVGINKDRIGTWVVCVATGFAGLAGTLAGPYITVYPSMGTDIVVIALIIVVAGGVGSLAGAMSMAVAWGFVTVYATQFAPSVAALLPYGLAFLLLAIKPTGIGRSREVAT